METSYKVTIHLDDVQQFLALMHTMLRNFEANYGTKPAGWILGPKEWLMLKAALEAQSRPLFATDWASLEHVNAYAGLPIVVTTEPGLRFSIEPDMAHQFYKGESE